LPAFAAKLVRAAIYGVLIGVTTSLTFTIAGAVLNAIGVNVLSPQTMGLMGFGLGFSAPLAVEYSKDLNESKGGE